MPARLLTVALLIALAIAASVRRTQAGDDTFKVIVHPGNHSDAVSRDFLRDAFLKKATDWNGKSLRPIDLSSKSSVRGAFREQVIRKSESQLRTYWNQQVFSGKGVPPPEKASAADVIAYVVANPGAVGYIPAGVDAGKAKVIKVK